MSSTAPWVVVVPLTAASLAFLVGGRWAPALGVAGGGATLAVAVALACAVWERGPLRYPIGGWGAPLGIDMYVDGLSVVMLLMSGAVGVSIAVYALGFYSIRGDGEKWRPGESFWPLLLVLWSALNAIFLSADVFNLYVGLELMTLAAVAQVILSPEREASAAAIRYLLAASLGSLTYLLGVALLYASFHTLDIALLGERLEPSTSARSAAGLITIGLALKSALFPLHFWLPRAHSTAPAPASAALSALVVTASFVVFIRLWLGVFPAVITVSAAQLVGAMGGGAIVWGSLQAIRQQRLKLMTAYSTVAQVGYLFLIVPLTVPWGSTVAQEAPSWAAVAWEGGIYHAVSHAFAKAAMFLAVGSIAQAIGDDRILGIRGIASHLPVTTYAFGLAGLSLVGVPPSGGFVAKWLLLSAAIESGQWWWAVVILLGGLLTAGYVFQVLAQELSHAESDTRPHFAPVPRLMEAATMALALAAFFLGLRAYEPILLLRIGSLFPAVVP